MQENVSRYLEVLVFCCAQIFYQIVMFATIAELFFSSFFIHFLCVVHQIAVRSLLTISTYKLTIFFPTASSTSV
jgi:hypothetical protein